MNTEYRLEVSEHAIQCSCPCSAVHHGPYAPSVRCEDTVPAGRQFGVMVLDGRVIVRRCQPCATAAGWISSVAKV